MPSERGGERAVRGRLGGVSVTEVDELRAFWWEPPCPLGCLPEGRPADARDGRSGGYYGPSGGGVCSSDHVTTRLRSAANGRAWRAIVAVVVLVCCGCFSPRLRLPVWGRVADAETGTPVAGASVILDTTAYCARLPEGYSRDLPTEWTTTNHKAGSGSGDCSPSSGASPPAGGTSSSWWLPAIAGSICTEAQASTISFATSGSIPCDSTACDTCWSSSRSAATWRSSGRSGIIAATRPSTMSLAGHSLRRWSRSTRAACSRGIPRHASTAS